MTTGVGNMNEPMIVAPFHEGNVCLKSLPQNEWLFTPLGGYDWRFLEVNPPVNRNGRFITPDIYRMRCKIQPGDMVYKEYAPDCPGVVVQTWIAEKWSLGYSKILGIEQICHIRWLNEWPEGLYPVDGLHDYHLLVNEHNRKLLRMLGKIKYLQQARHSCTA